MGNVGRMLVQAGVEGGGGVAIDEVGDGSDLDESVFMRNEAELNTLEDAARMAHERVLSAHVQPSWGGRAVAPRGITFPISG